MSPKIKPLYILDIALRKEVVIAFPKAPFTEAAGWCRLGGILNPPFTAAFLYLTFVAFEESRPSTSLPSKYLITIFTRNEDSLT
jgi:hypothetical protein